MIPAVVLAAGFGTRLRPLTDTCPKPLVPVAGRPMIFYPLMWLRRQGVTEVVINIHYLGEQIVSVLGDGASLGIHIRYSREEEILGTGGGIGRAWRLLRKRRVILLNSDTLLEADLPTVLVRHEQLSAAATLVLTEAPEKEYTPVWVDAAGAVVGIGGEKAPSPETRRTVYTGLAVLESELLDYLPSNRFAHLVHDGLLPAMSDGQKVASYFHHGYWKALDTPEKIREAEADILTGRLSLF